MTKKCFAEIKMTYYICIPYILVLLVILGIFSPLLFLQVMLSRTTLGIAIIIVLSGCKKAIEKSTGKLIIAS